MRLTAGLWDETNRKTRQCIRCDFTAREAFDSFLGSGYDPMLRKFECPNCKCGIIFYQLLARYNPGRIRRKRKKRNA